MGYGDIEYIIDALSKNGLSITRSVDNKIEWYDVCVVASGNGIIEYECPWLKYDKNSNTVNITNGEQILYGPTHPSLSNNEDVSIITGSLSGVNGVYAGSVRLDEFKFGFNCDGTGLFKIYLPPGAKDSLNQGSDIHQITFTNYLTGKETIKEFQLTNEKTIMISE